MKSCKAATKYGRIGLLCNQQRDIMMTLASNLMKEVANMVELSKRMDRFDAIVHEYLRKNHRTIEYLAEKIGCNPSSLWRYRHRLSGYSKMPLETFAECMRYVNVSNEDLRYILGLSNEK